MTLAPRRAWRVPLSADTYGAAEANAVAAAVRSGRLTQGKRVAAFEAAFARFLGAPGRRCLMVNSGSSANLLAAAALSGGHPDWDAAPRGTYEVITPAVTWATTPAPFIQHGFKPVFVDVDARLQMDPAAVRAAVTERTVAILPVHLLGRVCDVPRLKDIADGADAILIEDCCEALGASWDGRAVGTWGDVGTYSFYFSHHLNTVEGGALSLHGDVRGDACLWTALREHGWTRGYCQDHLEGALANVGSNADLRFLFDTLGYNVRSTEINAALGLVQLRRQAAWRTARLRAWAWYYANLRHPLLGHTPPWRAEEGANPFSYPLIVSPKAPFSKEALMERLAERGVETRPVMSGDITRQPWYARNPGRWRADPLPGAGAVHERGLLLPIHPGLTRRQLGEVRDAVDGFLRSRGVGGLERVEVMA